MSVEEMWYCSYRTVRKRGGGEERVPPLCHRMCRRPTAEQWEAVIDLAIEIVTGEAGWRHATISLTGERYWYFRRGWWLLTGRHEDRARLLVAAATKTEARRAAAGGSGITDTRDVAALLRRWKESGRWRRIASKIRSLRPNDPPKTRGRGKKRHIVLP